MLLQPFHVLPTPFKSKMVIDFKVHFIPFHACSDVAKLVFHAQARCQSLLPRKHDVDFRLAGHS